jgi:hypothetical protein
MSDVSVPLHSLKISDDGELPEFVDSEVGPDGSEIHPDDSASKQGRRGPASDASNASTKEARAQLLLMAMKKIEELENKIEELSEKQAAYGESPPLKRKKKACEYSAAAWSSRITKTGYFKVGHNKSAFHTNGARFAYIDMLMEHYMTSDFSKYTLDEIFEEDEDESYPIFQALLDARPVPHDFEECNLIGKNKLTSDFIKVAAAPPPMAAMTMVAMD